MEQGGTVGGLPVRGGVSSVTDWSWDLLHLDAALGNLRHAVLLVTTSVSHLSPLTFVLRCRWESVCLLVTVSCPQLHPDRWLSFPSEALRWHFVCQNFSRVLLPSL